MGYNNAVRCSRRTEPDRMTRNTKLGARKRATTQLEQENKMKHDGEAQNSRWDRQASGDPYLSTLSQGRPKRPGQRITWSGGF